MVVWSPPSHLHQALSLASFLTIRRMAADSLPNRSWTRRM
jgi:hypothetical protein